MKAGGMWKAMGVGLAVAAVGSRGLAEEAAPAATCPVEEPAQLEAALDVSVLSAYVWRGQVLNDEPVLQPSATLSKGGFALNTWASFDLTDATTGDSGEFTEVDLAVSYGLDIGPVALECAVVEFLFPNQTLAAADGASQAYPSTREVSLSVGLSGYLLEPGVTVAYDFGEVDSFYGLASLGYSAELAEVLSLDLSTSVGYGASDYNAYYFGTEDGAFNDANFGASVTWTPCDCLSLTPAYQYTMLIDSDIEDAAAGLYKDKDQSIFSLTATHTF